MDMPKDGTLRGESGWRYDTPCEGGKDARKLVTLRDVEGWEWVGIRAWHAEKRYWLDGGEPERTPVVAWQDLPNTAPGYWLHGQLLGDPLLAARGTSAPPLDEAAIRKDERERCLMALHAVYAERAGFSLDPCGAAIRDAFQLCEVAIEAMP